MATRRSGAGTQPEGPEVPQPPQPPEVLDEDGPRTGRANPAPRRALTMSKAGVRPAAARLSPLPAPPRLPPAEAAAAAAKPAAKARPGKDDRTVELVVPLPKSVRKAVRVKAEALGYTPEEVAYRLLRSWLDS